MIPPRIYVCGRLAIESGDRRVLERDFPARQGRLMWSYLVVHRQRPSGRLELAEALWGDDVPDGWDSTINAVTSRLRSTLRPVLEQWHDRIIATDGGRHQLLLPPGSFVDRERARSGLHDAESALRAGNLEAALGEARVAMEIAARGFMDGETAPWVEGQRRSLHTMRMHAWECTIEAELVRGNTQRAEREAEDLIDVDPLNERAYRLLMRASAALGNRAGTAVAMQRCQTILRQQAGIEPSLETVRLFTDLTGRSNQSGKSEGGRS